MKDIRKCGRDMSKTIIIDNLAENFQVTPENGIFILSWFHDPEDKALLELIPFLKKLVIDNVEDVRSELKN